MAALILFGVFTLLMLIGTPIAFCLGAASFAAILYMGLPPLVIFQQMNSGMSVFTLLAIPFFIYAGDLMVRGGIAQRIVNFAGSLVGHVRGGMGHVNVVTSVMFAGISGSALADAAGPGAIETRMMARSGYDKAYSAALSAASARRRVSSIRSGGCGSSAGWRRRTDGRATPGTPSPHARRGGAATAPAAAAAPGLPRRIDRSRTRSRPCLRRSDRSW